MKSHYPTHTGSNPVRGSKKNECFKEITMQYLKEKIFKVMESDLKHFENWLYDQIDLSEQMSESLIFELYNFNYNQRNAHFEFNDLFLSFFNQKENWIEIKKINNKYAKTLHYMRLSLYKN